MTVCLRLRNSRFACEGRLGCTEGSRLLCSNIAMRLARDDVDEAWGAKDDVLLSISDCGENDAGGATTFPVGGEEEEGAIKDCEGGIEL